MIKSNFSMNATPQFRVLTDDQLDELHLSTLEVLRRTGVAVKEPAGRDLLQKAGCWLDGERVRIPAHLVQWAVNAAPERVVLCDQAGAPAMYLEANKVYYGTGSDTPNVSDPYTGERRPALLSDVEGMARVVDALPNISFHMCMGIASDVNGAISDLYHFRAMIHNTAKPLVFTAWNLDNLKDIIAMAEAVVGGAEALQRSPFCALYTEPISPLQHAVEATQKLLYMAGKGLPTVYTPGMLTGAAAPITSAGSLVQANAELLSGLVMAQLAREGAPFIYGGGVDPMDMRTMIITYGSPEFMLNMSALTEMGRYYKLPVFSFAGCTDSKVFDEQAGIEGGLWMLVAALSGGNLVHDVGYIDNGLTSSYAMLVAMDEVAAMVRRFMGGVEVNTDTLALDVIDKVGPGGHFLAEDHTRKHFRANWFPKLFDRNNYMGWKESGGKTLAERAADKAREILETHKPRPVADAVRARLDEIVSAAERRVQG